MARKDKLPPIVLAGSDLLRFEGFDEGQCAAGLCKPYLDEFRSREATLAMVRHFLGPFLPEGVRIVRTYGSGNPARVHSRFADAVSGIEVTVPFEKAVAVVEGMAAGLRDPDTVLYDADDTGFVVLVVNETGSVLAENAFGNGRGVDVDSVATTYGPGDPRGLSRDALLERARWVASEVEEETFGGRPVGWDSSRVVRRAPEGLMIVMDRALGDHGDDLDALGKVADDVGGRFGMMGRDVMANLRLFRGLDVVPEGPRFDI